MVGCTRRRLAATVLLCAVSAAGCAERARGPGEPDDAGLADRGAAPSPRITVLPGPEIAFSGVLLGESATRQLTVRNVGDANLHVESVELVNDPNGDFSIVGATLPAAVAPFDDEDALRFDVTYRPSRAGEDRGLVVIRSDDPDTPELTVSLIATALYACVDVSPRDIEFRPLHIGTSSEAEVRVTNCGTAPLVVSSLALGGGTSEDFQIAAGLDGLTASCVGGGQVPCSGEAAIGPGETRAFGVRYAPSDDGADGGRVLLETNVRDQERLDVNLAGRGADNFPPWCLAEARLAGAPEWSTHGNDNNPLETIQRKTLEMRADHSTDPDGSIVSYKWTVLEHPEDSIAAVAPHEGADHVSVFLDLPGRYVFELEVTDNEGRTGSPPCRVVVLANADPDLHVQLVWHTPAGEDSDLDLHLLHPLGKWFCAPRDCWSRNPNPDWGIPFDPNDDPSLDHDDFDGVGPEDIGLNSPEDNRVYRVGVGYFDDHGNGPSLATVRIYVQGVLRFELANKRLTMGQFWEVATFDWPAGTVTPVDTLSDEAPDPACD